MSSQCLGGLPARTRRVCVLGWAICVAAALALPGYAFAGTDGQKKLRKHPPAAGEAIRKPKLPEQGPFLSAPPPARNDDHGGDLSIGNGINLTGRLGTTSDDSAAPGEPSPLKTKRAPLVPRQDSDFSIGKHALTDGASVGITLDLPSLGE